MAKVLVTGGAGFIGSHLVDELVKQNHEVTVLDDLSTGRIENLVFPVRDDIKFIEGSILNRINLFEAMHGQEYCFHQAAFVSVPRSVKEPLRVHELNATGTLNVLLTAQRAGTKRVIYASTAASYGNDAPMPLRESHTAEPETPYGVSKLAGEQYVRIFSKLYDLETVALRYFNVYGPRQDPSSPYSGVITKFITALKTGETPLIYGKGEQTRDFVYVGDVVNANIKAMITKHTGQVFNIGTGKPSSVREVLNQLTSIFQKPFSPRYELEQPGEVRHSFADISKAQKLLGYFPAISLETGLKITAENF